MPRIKGLDGGGNNMLLEGMYVRCPIERDYDQIITDINKFTYPLDFRDFIIGKIKKINNTSEFALIEFFDCTHNCILSAIHGEVEESNYPLNKIAHVSFRRESEVKYNGLRMIVKGIKLDDSGFVLYTLLYDNKIKYIVSEKDIIASYNAGYINPYLQLKKYEFQNPKWFLSRYVVSKTANIIENSLYGFKELAGCKIFLKPYQLKTVMRCLQEKECRYMLADEVGLGKTVEALAVLKVYLSNNNNKKVLIAAPNSLVQQWINELAFKFKLFEGDNLNGNKISIISISELNNHINEIFDFVILDEVHRFLKNKVIYDDIITISEKSSNILMLSATPLQKRSEEFLNLLKLIQPKKYKNYTNDNFLKILGEQNKIVKLIFDVYDEFNALNESLSENGFQDNEEANEIFELIIDYFNKIGNIINDNNFNKLINNISYSDEVFIYKIQDAIAYVCENYQLEKSIIRNRRTKIVLTEETNISKRELYELTYSLDDDCNLRELDAYNSFSDWVETKNSKSLDFNNDILPVVTSMFSSAAAYKKQIEILSAKTILDDDVLKCAERYFIHEKNICNNIVDYYESDEYKNRLLKILGFIDDNCRKGKIILFTNFKETFDLYKRALIDFFDDSDGKICSFFCKNMNLNELELNAYRFQNVDECRILLSDESGGEGRNFQNADILINIDLPWNVNDIEQRIGRLDRVGRDPNKNVISVVCYAKDTIEESLFKIWNDNLHLFTKAQSGLEIIMGDINKYIIDGISTSFKYGLDEASNRMGLLIKDLLDSLKKEQIYDIAAYQYKSINISLDSTVENFTHNESRLFENAMMGWAAMTGFNGEGYENNEIIYFYPQDISFKSMHNTLFIPPEFKLIIDDKLNILRNKVRELNHEYVQRYGNNYICGTFNRKLSIENDYLNFFAPGDDIYDSIINNALNTYKGTCAAFKINSNIKWKGFIFTWNIVIDDSLIFDNDVSEKLINQYRGFIPSEQFRGVFCIDDSKYTDEEVLREFDSLVKKFVTTRQCQITHLGERGGSSSQMKKFKNDHPIESWSNLVKDAQIQALQSAKTKASTKIKTLVENLKIELNNKESVQKAIANFYNNNDETLRIQKENEIILNVIKKVKLELDSVCYVEMGYE